MRAQGGTGESAPAAAAAVCVTCAAPLAGPYCAACGEKDAMTRDLSLRGFLVDSWSALTDFDARGYRSLRLLATRPGFLTAEYTAGRRRPYLSPIQVFLTANIIFFVAAWFLPVVTFDPPLSVYLTSNNYSDVAVRLLRARFLEMETVEYAAFESRFDFAVQQQAKSLVILFAAMFAAAIALLRIRSRDPAGVYLAFALHYVAFALLLFVMAGVAIALIRTLFGPGSLEGTSAAIPIAVVTALAVHLVPAVRRAFGASRIGALATALVLAALWLPGLLVYRMILLFTVLLTI
jgi:hypothetical protein